MKTIVIYYDKENNMAMSHSAVACYELFNEDATEQTPREGEWTPLRNDYGVYVLMHELRGKEVSGATISVEEGKRENG